MNEKTKKTILLIDDEVLIQDVGSKMLDRLGYNTLSAENGVEAVRLLTENKAAVSLVIVDIKLPDITGSELFDRIKQIAPSVKVLLSSGYSIQGEASQIMQKGCDQFIQKPFNMSELKEKINASLR